MSGVDPMEFDRFLQRVIDDGQAAARQSYSPGSDKLEGSLAGFEACRGKNVQELTKLLGVASQRVEDARFCGPNNEPSDRYWYLRCYQAEVEWVCNVVSAALLNEGLPTIIEPTARGVIKAAGVLGVRGPHGA